MARPREFKFTKMTGAGNDFVLIDARSGAGEFDWPLLAPALCDRRYGIGADGLLILKQSSKADFRMDYYNADGSYGGMCGNGGRCAARFVLEEQGGNAVSFEALDYVYSAATAKSEIQLRMKQPNSHRTGSLEVFNTNIVFHAIDTGTAHCVIFMDQLDERLKARIDVEGVSQLGAAIRRHEEFAPGGTNVDFIEITGTHELAMRTYERGVEAETLACGTGAVASAIVAHIARSMGSPIRVKTRSGEYLTVSFSSSEKQISDVVLSGSALIVFHGVYQLTA
jgi:diaminopimelate epimerase